MLHTIINRTLKRLNVGQTSENYFVAYFATFDMSGQRSRMYWLVTLTLVVSGLGVVPWASAVIVGGTKSDGPISTAFCELFNRTSCEKDREDCGGGTDACLSNLENPEKRNQCFVLWTNDTEGRTEVVYKGCWNNDATCKDQTDCVSHQSQESVRGEKKHIFCCCQDNYCNSNFTWQPITEQPITSSSLPSLRDIHANTLVWVLGSLTCVVLFVISAYYCYHRRKATSFNELPTLESTTLMPQSMCHSMPLKPIQLLDVKARGRFGAVYKGRLGPEEIVAVKIFPVLDAQSWLLEKQVYQLPQMSHENLLHFVGTEKRGDGPLAEFWLVTAYHDRGSLCDYLKGHTVTWREACHITDTMAAGLAYLHEELPPRIKGGCEAGKPSVAHRDFKSKNVLLKRDLTACVADFGLALVFHTGQALGDTHGQVGTRRYMAPEVLEGAINFHRDAFLRIDMYACGLVLWEVMSRCASQEGGIPADYHLPFEEEVGQHPTLDDMQECVAAQKRRPVIKDAWRQHPGMALLVDTMEECWDHDAEARLSASCVVERLTQLPMGIKPLLHQRAVDVVEKSTVVAESLNIGDSCKFGTTSFE